MVEDSEVSRRARDVITANDTPAAMEVHSPTNFKQGGDRGTIETRAPIASVKAAVSKFGGTVDWKARRIQAVERNMSVQEELEKVQEEIVQCGKRSEAAVETEFLALNQLENTKNRIEELKLSLSRAQTEEQHAKQDSELAGLRVKEMEQEIAKENDVMAEADLDDVAMPGHAAAATLELKSIEEELETLNKDFDLLVSEKDCALKSADDVIAASKEAEKELEELTMELMAIKKLLESAQAAHIEAEEQRISAAMAKEQDCSNWKKELDDAEEEICRLSLRLLSTEELKSNVNTASTLLVDLKAEMAAYMESILYSEISDKRHGEDEVVEAEKRSLTTKQSMVDSSKRELEEVKLNIEKAMAEVKCLKMAATSLNLELEGEKSTVAIIKQREGMPSVVAASLEAELEKHKSEIVVAEGNMKEAQENTVELSNQLEEATREADRAKSLAATAREELQKAKIEAQQAKLEARTMESRLFAAQKEVDAANASKMLALAAIKALQECDSAGIAEGNSPTGVTLSLEEYHELSKHAREAEEQANIRVTEAVSQIEAMKESEAKSQEMLEEASRELAMRREALKAANERAYEAKEGKLAAEQELRMWRAGREQQRKDSESLQEESVPTSSPRSSSSEVKESTNGDHPAADPALASPSEEEMQQNYTRADSLSDSKDGKKKKKKSFFPRMLSLLGRQKGKSK